MRDLLQNRMVGIGLAALGAVIILIMVFADMIGIGAHVGYMFIGWKQIIGIIVGAILLFGGLFIVIDLSARA
jgi:hypothetical protein